MTKNQPTYEPRMPRARRPFYLLLGGALTAAWGGGCDASDDNCQEPSVTCDGRCTDVANDRENCGGCGVACADGEVCSDGACAATECGGDALTCDGACVDPRFDPGHCGACDAACADGEVCSDGACATSCGPGVILCGDVCVDDDVDRSNCGGCGNVCADGENCIGGSCVPCSSGEILCGDACVDTQASHEHCGGCDTGCLPHEACEQGTCVVSTPDALVSLESNHYEESGLQVVYRGAEGTAVPVDIPDLNYDCIDDAAPQSDGSFIVRGDIETFGVAELFYIPAAGSSITKISGPLVDGGNVQSITTCDDNTTVIYDADADTDGVSELYAVSVNNPGAATKLTPDGVPTSSYQATSDCSKVLAHLVDGGHSLWVADVATSTGFAVDVLASTTTGFADEVLSPDGSTVAFQVGTGNGDDDLYSVAATSGALPVQLDNETGTRFYGLAFSPDSSRLVFFTRNNEDDITTVAMAAPGTAGITPLGGTSGVNAFSERFHLTSDSQAVVYGYFDNNALQQTLRRAAFATPTQSTVLLAEDGNSYVDQLSLSADGTVAIASFYDSSPFRHLTSNIGGAQHAIEPGGFDFVNEPNSLRVAADGRRVYFSSWHENLRAPLAYYVDADTPTEVRTLLAPDVGEHLGDVNRFDAGSGSSIYVADDDTEYQDELFHVTHSSPPMRTKLSGTMPAYSDVREVALSDDESTAFFTADVDVYSQSDLYTVPVASPGQRVKLNPTLTVDGEIKTFVPNGSGTKVVYTASQDDASRTELYVVDVANPGVSTKLATVTADGGEVRDIVLDAAFQTVYFRADLDDDGQYDLYSVPVSGASAPSQLVAGLAGSGVEAFALSPDENDLVYDAYDGTQNHLYRLSLTAPALAVQIDGGENNLKTDFAITAADYVFYRATGATGRTSLFYVDLAAPTASVELSGILGSGSDVFSFIVNSTSTAVVFRADVSSGRDELYYVELSSPGARTKLNQDTPSTNHDIFGDYAFTPDESGVIYRGDLILSSRNELFVSTIANPGISTRLHPSIPGDDVLSYELFSNGTVVYYGDWQRSGLEQLYMTSITSSVYPTVLSELPTPKGVDRLWVYGSVELPLSD